MAEEVSGKKLDLPKAATLTREILEENLQNWSPVPNKRGEMTTGYSHLMKLLTMIIEEQVVDDQANRFLGWVQACIVMQSPVSQAEFADINRSCRFDF